MHWFENILIVLFWAIQIGITVVIALIVGGIIQAIEQLIGKKKVKLFPRALVMLVLIVAILAALAVNPPVICPEQYKERFTQEQHHAVQAVSRGLYSSFVPLVPGWVQITDVDGYTLDGQREWEADFTVHYLWFGTVGLEYDSRDGYNVTKPLSGW